MEALFFIICNTAFFVFLHHILYIFNFESTLSSSWILLAYSFILTLPSIIFIDKKINEKKYFIFSSIWIISLSLIFFVFGKNILSLLKLSSGLTNYTIYLYKYLFMFSPFLSIFFISLYKIFAQKKQLILLIALKYILPIISGLIFIHFLEFYKLLWLFAILDLTTTIFSICFAKHYN